MITARPLESIYHFNKKKKPSLTKRSNKILKTHTSCQYLKKQMRIKGTDSHHSRSNFLGFGTIVSHSESHYSQIEKTWNNGEPR